MINIEKKVNEYINTVLLSKAEICDDVIPDDKMKSEIVNRLFSRKFRKYSISPDVKDNVTIKIQNIIDNSLPMRFIPSFGGYKHWWAPTYPAVDWAEVFNMKFLLQYLAPIYNSYTKAPVTIEYESEEVILSELNNVPQFGLDLYTRTFRRLAQYFSQMMIGKTKIELTLARELYDVSKLHRLIEESYAEHEKRFDSYDLEDQERRIKKVASNYLLNGVNDYTHISEEELYKLYKHSRVLNETFLDVDFELRPNYFEGESSIPLLFSFGLGPGGEAWIHIGSCSTSMVDFWAGMGILEYWEEDDKFVQRIVSRSQYESIKNDLIRVQVNSDLSDIADNFKYIYIYLGRLNFG